MRHPIRNILFAAMLFLISGTLLSTTHDSDPQIEIDAVGVAVGARHQPRHEGMKRLVAQTPHGSADSNPRERMEDLRGGERGNAHGRPGSY